MVTSAPDGDDRGAADGSPPLRARLLGAVELRRGDQILPPLESARARSLLAYLLLNGESPQSRQHLAYTLWPDSTDGQARTNLRHLLHNLRQVLPIVDQYLEVTPQTLRWRIDSSLWLDVTAFEDAVARADGAVTGSDEEIAALRDAVDHYAGDLLEGSYDEWLFDRRERLHHRHLTALARLTTLLSERGRHADAAQFGHELLRGDPLREDTYRLLMAVHQAAGDRARAVRVYHACATTLRRELGVEPSTLTADAYEALIRTERPTAAAPSPGPRSVEGTPLIGRTDEWRALTDRWRSAELGSAMLVVVAGEAGVGKSRLVEELQGWCAHRGATVAVARSYPAEGELGYGAVTSWLRTDELAARVRRLGLSDRTELARLLPELLTEDETLPQPERLPETDERRRLFDAVAHAVVVRGRPTLLVADDAQWCDAQSLQLVHYLLRVDADAPLLVVVTARREELTDQHPLLVLVGGIHALERAHEIELGRLDRRGTIELARSVGGGELADADLARLHVETEGNPLFVVETLRAGLVSGVDDGTRLSPKLQAVIGARLDQLSAPARALVGVAATVGRDFTSDVVGAASGLDDVTVARALDEAWRRGIIREQGVEAYDFGHGKIREVAYLTLGAAERRHQHLRVAETLRRLRQHDPGPVSGQLAAHYERGGAVDEAIGWLGIAAEQAEQLHAHTEAVRLLERALGLTATLPEGTDRRRRELRLLVALVTPLAAIEGFGADRLAGIQRRTIDAAAALGEAPDPPLLRSLAMLQLSQADFDGARRVGAELQARGARERDDVLVVEGDYVLGIAEFWGGRFTAARGHFEQAVRRARPEHRPVHLLHYGQDPHVACLGRLGNTLWFLGRSDEAVEARDAAVRLAEEIGHPNSRNTAVVFAALLALELGDDVGVRDYVARLNASDPEHRWRQVHAAAEAFAGYVDVLDGAASSGVARIRRTLDRRDDVDHAPGERALVMRLLLAAHEAAPDVGGALAATDEALALGGSRIWESEAHRLRAELLAAAGAPRPAVVDALTRALAAARRDGSVPLEGRAVRSGARLGLADPDAEERRPER